MSQGSVDELMKEPASDLLCRFQGEVLRGYFHIFPLGNFHMKNCFFSWQSLTCGMCHDGHPHQLL